MFPFYSIVLKVHSFILGIAVLQKLANSVKKKQLIPYSGIISWDTKGLNLFT